MQKTAHRKWLEKTAREADRFKLASLRRAVKDAKLRKRGLRLEARTTCSTAREAVRTYAREERTRLKSERERLKRERANLKDETKRRRAGAESVCSTGRSRVAKGAQDVAHARGALASELDDRAVQKRWAGKKGPTLAAREVKQESDSEVLANLSESEAIVFEAVKAKIKPTGRMTRTEAFYQWVHDHSADVARIIDRHYQDDVAKLEREQAAHWKAMQKSYAKASDRELGDRINHGMSLAG